MATADHLTRLRNIRNALESEFENELNRRLALTAAGSPPPSDYSVGGKSYQWSGYVTMMTARIKDLNEMILNMGGDEGGIPEVSVQMW